MNKYNCTDGHGDLEIEAETAKAAAREWAETGDWGDRSQTLWITVRVTPLDGEGEEIDDESESHTITLDPEEPECADGKEHDWQSPLSIVGGCKENPGVQGHGGGVIITCVCAHCGCYQIIDTWAQNPENGEQGLRSVEYKDADEETEAWVASRRR